MTAVRLQAMFQRSRWVVRRATHVGRGQVHGLRWKAWSSSGRGGHFVRVWHRGGSGCDSQHVDVLTLTGSTGQLKSHPRAVTPQAEQPKTGISDALEAAKDAAVRRLSIQRPQMLALTFRRAATDQRRCTLRPPPPAKHSSGLAAAARGGHEIDEEREGHRLATGAFPLLCPSSRCAVVISWSACSTSGWGRRRSPRPAAGGRWWCRRRRGRGSAWTTRSGTGWRRCGSTAGCRRPNTGGS